MQTTCTHVSGNLQDLRARQLSWVYLQLCSTVVGVWGVRNCIFQEVRYNCIWIEAQSSRYQYLMSPRNVFEHKFSGSGVTLIHSEMFLLHHFCLKNPGCLRSCFSTMSRNPSAAGISSSTLKLGSIAVVLGNVPWLDPGVLCSSIRSKASLLDLMFFKQPWNVFLLCMYLQDLRAIGCESRRSILLLSIQIV